MGECATSASRGMPDSPRRSMPASHLGIASMLLSFAAPALKGGHDVLPKSRDQPGSARTRIRQAPDAEGVESDLKRYNEAGETGAPSPELPRQPVGQELVMKKILSLAFVAMLSLALAAPAYAGRGHGG